MPVSVGVLYRNSAMTCVRTSLFLAINFNKNLYTALGVSSVSSVLNPKNERLLLDVIIYIIYKYIIYIIYIINLFSLIKVA